MLIAPYFPTKADLRVWLRECARSGEPGMYAIDDPWPDTILKFGDCVAIQGVVLPGDYATALDLFESWLDELDAADG